MRPEQALEAAVEKIGGQNATARLLGISQAAVWKWISAGKALPAQHVLRVEEATGISRHDLRPDLYPREDRPLSPEPRESEGPSEPDDSVEELAA